MTGRAGDPALRPPRRHAPARPCQRPIADRDMMKRLDQSLDIAPPTPRNPGDLGVFI